MAIFIGNKLPKTIGLGISFTKSFISEFLTWGQSIPARFWGTETPEYWGGIDAQAQVHYNRVIADGGVVPAGLGGVNSFFQVVKAIYGTTDINTAISAAYDAHYLGYKLGAGSGTTLGQAAQKLYAPKGIFGGIGTGSAFWEGVGVSGNFLSTPNAAANQITGDIDIIYRGSFITNPSGNNVFIGKWDSGLISYYFGTNGAGNLRVGFNVGGSTQFANSSATYATGVNWYRVTRSASTGVVTFFQSTQNTSDLSSVTWTQLGTTQSTTAGSLTSTTSTVSIFTSGTHTNTGTAYRATIANSIGGTPIVDFNANQYTGANTWTSTTSEVWTVNSTGAGLADVTQTTAASQPLLLAHTGENYWWGSGVTGNFVSTPNASANIITENLELTVYNINWRGSASIRYLISKTNTYSLSITSTNFLGIEYRVAGVTLAAVSTAIISTSFNGSVRVFRNSTSGEITFYTSTDNVNFTQLGTVVLGTIGAISNLTDSVFIGSYNSTIAAWQGSIGRVTIATSLGGTPVVDFNPASYNPSVSQTQWSSATGEVWSLNVGTATSGYKGQVVTKSTTQSDGIDDRMQSLGYALTATGVSVYSTYRKFTSTSPSAFSIVVETSANANTNQGFLVDFNDGTNTSFNAIRGNVDRTNAFFLDTSILLKLVTSVFDLSLATEEASFYAVNNSALTKAGGLNSNNTTMTTSGLNLMARNNTTTGIANMIFDGLIISNIADNSTQRTAMYNYLRSINNNAF